MFTGCRAKLCARFRMELDPHDGPRAPSVAPPARCPSRPSDDLPRGGRGDVNGVGLSDEHLHHIALDSFGLSDEPEPAVSIDQKFHVSPSKAFCRSSGSGASKSSAI